MWTPSAEERWRALPTWVSRADLSAGGAEPVAATGSGAAVLAAARERRFVACRRRAAAGSGPRAAIRRSRSRGTRIFFQAGNDTSSGLRAKYSEAALFDLQVLLEPLDHRHDRADA